MAHLLGELLLKISEEHPLRFYMIVPPGVLDIKFEINSGRRENLGKSFESQLFHIALKLNHIFSILVFPRGGYTPIKAVDRKRSPDLRPICPMVLKAPKRLTRVIT